VTVTVDERTYHRMMNSRADHLSQDSRLVHVGVGKAEHVDRIHITWPDGSQLVVEDVATDQRIVVSPDGRQKAGS